MTWLLIPSRLWAWMRCFFDSKEELGPAIEVQETTEVVDSSKMKVVSVLEQLKRLHDAEVITDEEFAEKRKELLDRL